MYTNWHGIFYIIKMALFALIKKASYTRCLGDLEGFGVNAVAWLHYMPLFQILTAIFTK